MFETIGAARAAGFRERRPWEYGGEEVTVRGRVLVRGPSEAWSRTRWGRLGFRVRAEAVPLCVRTAPVASRGAVTYPVYRDDQVARKRVTRARPPVEIDVLAALWALNRRARRCRDLAGTFFRCGLHGLAAAFKREKAELYDLKGQALHALAVEGGSRRPGATGSRAATAPTCSRARALRSTAPAPRGRMRMSSLGPKSSPGRGGTVSPG